MSSKLIYLSYVLNETVPSYGNRNRFEVTKKSDMAKGDVANDTSINTTVHIGTHIDMPFHFFQEGQTIENYEVDFFSFKNVLFIEVETKNVIIKDELISKLEKIENKEKYDILIVKTGICYKRQQQEFWEKNYGFDPLIAECIREKFTNIRVFGFDSISISSFSQRLVGREAHRAFLDPQNPILLLEDMDLTKVDEDTYFNQLTIAPLRISGCDGLPCTVIGDIN